MIEDVKSHGVPVILLNADERVVESLSGVCQQLRLAKSLQHVSLILAGTIPLSSLFYQKHLSAKFVITVVQYLIV